MCLAKSSTDAALEAMHIWMYAGFGGECVEHLASDNGTDMHKYNTLYTHRLIVHVLSPLPKIIKTKIRSEEYHGCR